jgi:hypothetical protein
MPALQMHCTENSKQIFPEMTANAIQENMLTDRGNSIDWERGRAVSFLGMFVSNFRYSVGSLKVKKFEPSGVRINQRRQRDFYLGIAK